LHGVCVYFLIELRSITLSHKSHIWTKILAKILKKSILEDLKNKIKPDLVVIPSLNDPHQDHKTVAEESLRVFRHNISIICYEEPWNHSKFEPKFFVRLTKGHLNHKINALKKYKTQRKLKRFYFDYKFIEGLARVRGSHIFSEYAEGFEVIKLIQ